MRTTVTMRDTTLEQARRIAHERGVTISDVIEEAVQKHLCSRPQTEAKPFQLHTVSGRLVNPRIDLDRISELLEADDIDRYGER